MSFNRRFLIVFYSLAFCSCNYSKELKFQQIEFCDFKPVKDQSALNDSLYISYYVRIDKNDSVFAIENFTDSGDSINYYKGKLSTEKKDSLYTVFNGNDLQQYFYTKQLDSGSYNAAQYQFFYVSYPENKTDSIAFISLFVKPQLNSASNIMFSMFKLPEADKKSGPPFRIPEVFYKILKRSYKKASYLPEIFTPPPFRMEDQ